ncbi:MAG TPA: DUF2169 domain-containing protein [Terriglobia bacterium]|nr:DUF2169 domain-containing protein [Terriglobia bacterium]
MASANGVFEIVPGKNDNGDHIFSVVVKRTFRIEHGSVAKRCAADHELRKIDAYYDNGDPEWSTVQYEYELAPYKPGVDIVVIGKAHAFKGVPTTQMTISVRIGNREKSIIVFGDRECRYRENMPPAFSDPKPFTEMEIRYERAYGGRDEKSDPNIPFFYPRNFMGTGVVLRNTKDTVEGLALPNFEDPNDLLTADRIILGAPESWPRQPLPQGFGWFQRTWYPRCTFAGSYPAYVDVDTVTTEERLGLVPKNHVALAKQFKLPSYDTRLNNGASHGMLLPDIKGEETVSLRGLSSDGLLEFALPRETPKITLDIGLGAEPLQPRLDTVSIRPDDLEVDLIWRGACVYEGYSWLPQMKKLQAEVN